MKHATAAALRQLSPLIDTLRVLDGLRQQGPGRFYRRSAAFLHFHEDASGLFADVKLEGAGFTRVPVDTPAQQQILLSMIHRALDRLSCADNPGVP